MDLNDQEKRFITNYNKEISEILEKRNDQLRRAIIQMPKGDERDVMILFVKELTTWQAQVMEFGKAGGKSDPRT